MKTTSMVFSRIPVPAMTALACLLALAACGQPQVELGAVLPLSGEAGGYGRSVRQGIELAFATIGQDPELPFELSLAVADSGSDPEQAADRLAELYERCPAVIGGVTDPEAFEMVVVADRTGRLLLSPTASSPRLTGISASFYRLFPSAREEALAMAGFASQSIELDRLVVVAEEGPLGNDLAAALREVFRGEILAEHPVTAETDLEAMARDIVELEPPAVYVAADGSPLARILKALREAGFDGDEDWILASSALSNPAVIEEAEGAAERAYLTQTVFDRESEEQPMQRFVDQYLAEYGERPDLFAAHGYDAVLVLVEALVEGGGTLPSDLAKGMRAINSLPGVTGNLQFRESGDVQKFVRIHFVSGGLVVDYEQWRRRKVELYEERRREIERRLHELRQEAEREEEEET